VSFSAAFVDDAASIAAPAAYGGADGEGSRSALRASRDVPTPATTTHALPGAVARATRERTTRARGDAAAGVRAALNADPTVESAHAAAVEAELSALLGPFYGGSAERTSSLVEGEHHLERYAALMQSFTANVSPRRSGSGAGLRGAAAPSMGQTVGVAAQVPNGRFGVQVLREAEDTFGVSLRHDGGDGTSWRT
jgi:hypothetical protein